MIYDEKRLARDRAEAQLVQDVAAAAQADAQVAPAGNEGNQNNGVADAAAVEEVQENAAAVIPTETDYMEELKPITHEEHIHINFYHIPNVNMIESLNLATVRDLNAQVVPGTHIAQGCIDSREDVIRAHIRFLIDTDVAVTDGNVQHPAPHKMYVLPRILAEPEKEQDKKVPAAPPLEEDRDPFLDGDDDDDDDCDKGKKKKRRSASPAAQTNRRYPVCTPGQKKKKTK